MPAYCYLLLFAKFWDRETTSLFLGTLLELFVLFGTIIVLIVIYYWLDTHSKRQK